MNLHVPEIFVFNTQDVSVGTNSICAVSELFTLVCWHYYNRGLSPYELKLIGIPSELSMDGMILSSAKVNKHSTCAVVNTAINMSNNL